MPLSPREVQTAKPREKDYKLSDERGMYLLVKKNGAKLWRLKYRIHGKEKTLSIGQYPDITLKRAREIRDEARSQLTEGIDPSAHKQATREERRLSAVNSFEAIAREWYSIHMANKSESHQQRTMRCMEMYLFPFIGHMPITAITPPMLLNTLRKTESTGKIETAQRAKQAAGQVFRFAVATGRADRDPTPDLKGALKSPVKTHYASIIEPREVGRLLVDIDHFTGTHVVRCALKLSALFFCRPGELRHLKWSNINYEERRIEIIAEKTKQEHIIPLANQAITILEELQRITGDGEYLFPSARGRSRPMSDNGVRTALRDMGYSNDKMTPHGFRAMARTLLDEVLNYRIEWIEQQLAHAVKDPNGRAYNRTKHLQQRTEMMQHWADYLDQLKAQALAGNVVIGNFKQA